MYLSMSLCLNSMRKSQGNTALHWAVIKDRLSAVSILLDAGADPNLTNKVSQCQS